MSGIENRLTMEDIAREAGVSPITVSRALSGNPLVKQETRDRIVKLAKDRGYQVNIAARNLRQGRTHTIAVVIEMPPTMQRPMSEPYPLSLLGGIIQELSHAGYNAALATVDNFVTLPPAVDAVILLGQGKHEQAVKLIQQCGLPLVVWGSVQRDSNYVTVGSNNENGGELVAERFIEQGRRNAVFLGDVHHAEAADRLMGFSARLASFDGRLLGSIACPFTTEGGSIAMQAMLDEHGKKIDSVFCASDLVAMGAVRTLIQHGISVPEVVSVIGFDDSTSASLFAPPLTTVRQEWHRGGRLLARKALAMAQNESAQSEMMPVQLIIRNS